MQPVAFYKCLAEETRLQCLLLIQQEEELCVCELTEALQQSQPKISRHLAQLRQCELLQDRREGQWVYYRLNPEMPHWCQQVITDTLQNNHSLISSALQRLHTMGERPERKRSCC